MMAKTRRRSPLGRKDARMTFDAVPPFLGSRAPQVSRRAVLSALASTPWWLAARPAAAAAPSDPLPAAKPLAQDVSQRVKAALEIQGELKLNSDGKKPTRTPLEVKSEQQYHERLPAAKSKFSQLAALRHYDEAQATYQIGRSKFSAQLDTERPLIGLEPQADGNVLLFSPMAPLTRDELDLLDIPCNTALAHQLLPNKPIPVGETWKPSDLAWAQFLGLETIQDNQTRVKFDRWDGDSALLVAEGTLEATVGGVGTDLELKGKLQVDRRSGRITWIAFGISEDRAIGHAEPGFQATMRIRALIEPLDNHGPLADRALADLPWQSAQANTLIAFQATHAGLRLLLDRRWRVMTHRPDQVILRLVDRGDLVAQCNLSRLPPLAAGKQLSLEEFQEDIRQVLGPSFQQFTEGTQNTEEGRRVLRVVAVGEASALPIQWVYDHVSTEDGQRFVAAFSVEAALVERFAEADRALVEAAEILPFPASAATPNNATDAASSAPKSDAKGDDAIAEADAARAIEAPEDTAHEKSVSPRAADRSKDARPQTNPRSVQRPTPAPAATTTESPAKR